MSRSTRALVAVLGLALAVAPAVAAKGGKNPLPPAGCSVSAGVVRATGLPTDQVVNFLLTSSSGTTGWVLGFTTDGTWSVNVPAPAGPTTYQFVGKTSGPGGSRYDVFASCSA
jgi:hypothetical protein